MTESIILLAMGTIHLLYGFHKDNAENSDKMCTCMGAACIVCTVCIWAAKLKGIN